MSKTIELRSEIDTKIWELLKEKFADLEDNELMDMIVKDYSKFIMDESEEGNLIKEIDDQRKLSESLRKKCKNFALRVKELEDVQADQENEIQKLKKQNKKLSKDFPDFEEKQKVKEKIVYREDTKTIKELKEKRDALQKSVWEKNADLEKSERAISELNQTLEKFEIEKGKAYAILVKLALNKETSNYEFDVENISRGEFNKLMRSKQEFCKYKKINTPATVIQLWEKDNEDNGILDLTDVVEQLRNKTDTKLKEISLPFSQYESLKEFENKYSGLKEENDKLKVEYKNLEDKHKELLTNQEHLKKEITHLKENPIVKEKIVYKENTKEFNEIKAECERLRLKLFNYETGHMKMPTHGINVGNIYKVKILGVGKDGDGFTRVNNFIIFVPDTNKDQEVNIKITRVLKKYAFGKTVGDTSGEQVLDATSGMVTQPTAELPTKSQPEEVPEKDVNEAMDESTSETK